MQRNEIFTLIQSAMVELFELDPEDIVGSALLNDDLDLDSIDAVDLIVHLQNQTKRKIQPEVFKAVRTVDDVVEAVVQLLAKDPE
ncbi:acyl carrier protein [Agarivorans sp. QJM3NY_33]|uniref:acyl carrier protein n=1 Tax=Agarivorans sp. QJM3NY_33 TaxID=3421432 RepID=UPI003D7DE938